MTARRLAAAASATVALVVLTGCQQPTPKVTVRSDRAVVTVDAERWCKDNKVPADGQCPQRAVNAPVLNVAPGTRVTVDVPRAVAHQGWLVAINGQQVSNLQKDHFVAVTADAIAQVVQAQAAQGQGGLAQLQIVRLRAVGVSLSPSAAPGHRGGDGAGGRRLPAAGDVGAPDRPVRRRRRRHRRRCDGVRLRRRWTGRRRGGDRYRVGAGPAVRRRAHPGGRWWVHRAGRPGRDRGGRRAGRRGPRGGLAERAADAGGPRPRRDDLPGAAAADGRTGRPRAHCRLRGRHRSGPHGFDRYRHGRPGHRAGRSVRWGGRGDGRLRGAHRGRTVRRTGRRSARHQQRGRRPGRRRLGHSGRAGGARSGRRRHRRGAAAAMTDPLTTDPLTLGISPCPNDTFIFRAWVHGRVPGAPPVTVAYADIGECNTLAARGALDIVKVSFGALPWFCLLYTSP